MTDAKLVPPHVLTDQGAPELELPPARAPQPGAVREAVIHWIITVGGFTAMLLVGLMFTK